MLNRVHQSYIVVGLCVGIVIGAIVAMGFRINYFASPVWIVSVLIFLVVAYFSPRFVFVIVAVVAGMVLAFFRVSGELVNREYIQQFKDLDVTVSGTIVGDATVDEDKTKFKLGELCFGESEGNCANGSLYVTIDKNEELRWGDKVELTGKMLDGFGIYAGYLYKPRIRKWERPEPGLWVLRVRDWFAERIERLIPEPEVKLGLSYLLGMKSGLPDDLNENLRVVGLTHIVVASGAHLAILVEVAKKIFGKLSRFVGVLFSVLFVVFFMCMVGWTPSILRAGIMTILTLVMWYGGRKFEPWRLILSTMAASLIIEPGFVVNMGWQLSFASYVGIMVLGPRMAKYFYGKKKPGWIGSTVLTSISATLMTLPILLYNYGTASLVSVVANLLILPTLPYAMGLVFLTGVVSGLPLVETAVAWCATRMLDFHIAVVGWFGEMRMFLVEIPKYQWWVWGIYGVIGISFVCCYLMEKRKNQGSMIQFKT